jgi:A/G-specific adenine glycosylase
VAAPADEILAFREVVLGYRREHGRDLPWRRTTDPYAVLVSEVMLQQTQVPDAALLPIMEATLDLEDPRTWYWALMDYGTYLKRALPNPSRRSAHHARQGRFEGSNRQLRSWLLRELTARSGQSLDDLARATEFPRVRVAEALQALAAEGFLASSDGRFSIA